MKFGSVKIEAALGAIAAHAVRLETVVLKKGDIVTAEHITALKQAEILQIIVAQLEHDDVGEDVAAQELATHCAGSEVRLERPFTGRVNIFAKATGVLKLDGQGINRVNAVDEAITLATLPPFRAVSAGEMIATVKIIPFAVPRKLLNAAKPQVPLIAVAPFKPLNVAVISTLLPGLKPSVIAKTLNVLQRRLDLAGAKIRVDVRVAHETALVSAAILHCARSSDVVVVFGASAITDRRDVIPAALELCGGSIEHFGMPVDPGNLLLLGALGPVPVLGAPGCARSAKENGFDWVLQRLLAGLSVNAADLRSLGVGGLLMEIGTRPQPRRGDVEDGDVDQ